MQVEEMPSPEQDEESGEVIEPLIPRADLEGLHAEGSGKEIVLQVFSKLWGVRQTFLVILTFKGNVVFEMICAKEPHQALMLLETLACAACYSSFVPLLTGTISSVQTGILPFFIIN
jgi:hypothetical protein